jgi:hypothetical protein
MSALRHQMHRPGATLLVYRALQTGSGTSLCLIDQQKRAPSHPSGHCAHEGSLLVQPAIIAHAVAERCMNQQIVVEAQSDIDMSGKGPESAASSSCCVQHRRSEICRWQYSLTAVCTQSCNVYTEAAEAELTVLPSCSPYIEMIGGSILQVHIHLTNHTSVSASPSVHLSSST